MAIQCHQLQRSHLNQSKRCADKDMTCQMPAAKAGKKMSFGKEVVVKAKPAKTVVKAFPMAALKRSI
eukprot:8385853-Karenia_brevis.AAC.1